MSGSPVLVKRLTEFPMLPTLTGNEDIPCVIAGQQYRFKSSQLVSGGNASPGLYGPLSPFSYTDVNYLITSYDMVTAPVASVDHGTLIQNGPNLVYNAGSYAGPVVFTVGTATFNATVLPSVVNAPSLVGFTSPIAVSTPLLYLNYSAFTTSGLSDTLASVEVQYDTVSTFNSANLVTTTTLAASVPVDPITKVIGIEIGPLQKSTTYYVRVQYTGAVLPAGAWSEAIVLNTAAQFVANNTVADLLDPDTGVDFGFSVAMDTTGTICAVGDYGQNIPGGGTGKVYIYTKTSNTWALTGSFDAGLNSNYFGYALAMSGDGTVLVVGDYYAYNATTSTNTGAVYIYTNVSGTWTQSFVNYSAVSGSYFGQYVAISQDGKTVAAGGYQNSSTLPVSIYTLAAGTWSNSATVLPSDTVYYFGSGLSLNSDGTVLIVGATNYYYGPGAVYTFLYSNAAWAQISKIADPSGNYYGNFGLRNVISAQGTVLIIASPNTSQVYFYQNSGNYNWGATTVFNAPAVTDHNVSNFGSSVCVNAAGTVAFIGANGTTIPNGQGGTISTGEAYAYVFQNNTWTYLTQITPAVSVGNLAYFGTSMATNSDGSALIVGAYQAANYTGSAFIVN